MPHVFEPTLTREQLGALRQSCAPMGVLTFPPADLLFELRKLDYIEVVLGGVQITKLGLERLIRENERIRMASSNGEPPQNLQP